MEERDFTSDVHLIVPDPKPCHFCPCDAAKLARITQVVSVCCCPCHWQNAFGLKDKLEAVKYFFGERLT